MRCSKYKFKQPSKKKSMVSFFNDIPPRYGIKKNKNNSIPSKKYAYCAYYDGDFPSRPWPCAQVFRQQATGSIHWTWTRHFGSGKCVFARADYTIGWGHGNLTIGTFQLFCLGMFPRGIDDCIYIFWRHVNICSYSFHVCVIITLSSLVCLQPEFVVMC